MKRTIFRFRTGTFHNQKHAACFTKSTNLVCPLPECHHKDSALHILSGCQCPIIRNSVTERDNIMIAIRMVLKTVSKGSYRSDRVCGCRQRRPSDPA
eukprot:1156274-Pelagomonas_calceolata.AAC.5